MKLKRHRNYIIATMLLLIIEVCIAIFIPRGFIRYTFGDYLVVILRFCFVKSFIAGNSFNIAIGVLCFAFLIEFLQLPNIIEILNLQNNHLIKIILGSTFQLSDLVVYTLGIITVLIIEYKTHKLWIT